MYNKSISLSRRFRRLTLHSGYLAESASQPHIKVPGGWRNQPPKVSGGISQPATCQSIRRNQPASQQSIRRNQPASHQKYPAAGGISHV